MTLQTITTPQTMSSREIAELTGKRHDNVIRDIRKMLAELYPTSGGSSERRTPPDAGEYHRGDRTQYKFLAEGTIDAFMAFGVAKPATHSFEYIYTDPQNGQSYPEFRLPKRETLVLIAGYSIELRARIIDRWQELEAQQAPQVPHTLAQALRLAADQAEQLERQQAALAAAAPKVEYVDRYVAANGAMGFRQVANLLQANEHEFRAWLQDQKIMYRLGGEWAAYQNHIDAGRFVVKAGVSTVNEHAFSATKFTPKGVHWIAGEWAKHKLSLVEAVA